VSDQGELAPRWPAWYAPVAFVVVVGLTTVIAGILLAITNTKADDNSAAVTIVGTLIQAGAFIGTAVMFASFVDKPRPWQFGLRRTRFWPAVGWAALGLLAFYLFAILYSAAVNPDVKQKVTQELGADQGTAGLIAAGVVVIVVAPIAEEFFFRGFFYRALRTRMAVPLAAAVDGVVFGAIHIGGSPIAVLPVLAVLGFIFCLVYERTGTLFATIAMHALNNFAAYGAATHKWAVAGGVAVVTIGACVTLPGLLPTRPVAARSPAGQ
jgi:membrane protease YdiL (CAAX protease family)